MKPYFESQGIQLYFGDCRDVIETLPAKIVDLLFTDPPYGQSFQGDGATTKSANIRADGARQGVRVVRQMMGATHKFKLFKPDAHLLMFTHWEGWPDFYDMASSYVPIKNALIWHKDRGGMGDTELEYARDYEVILYGAMGRRALSGRRDGAVIRGFPPVGNERVHPTEKPIPLCESRIRKHTAEGDLVFDPFCGVGPVLQAAAKSGRKAIGIELEEKWCEIAAKRLETTTAQGQLI